MCQKIGHFQKIEKHIKDSIFFILKTDLDSYRKTLETIEKNKTVFNYSLHYSFFSRKRPFFMVSFLEICVSVNFFPKISSNMTVFCCSEQTLLRTHYRLIHFPGRYFSFRDICHFGNGRSDTKTFLKKLYFILLETIVVRFCTSKFYKNILFRIYKIMCTTFI